MPPVLRGLRFRFHLEPLLPGYDRQVFESVQEKAENLKTTLGILTQGFDRGAPADAKKDNDQGKKIFEAMVPGLVDFVQQAAKCLEYYKDHAAHEHGLGGEGGSGK